MRIALSTVLAAGVFVCTGSPVQVRTGAPFNVVERFLSSPGEPLVSFRALRRRGRLEGRPDAGVAHGLDLARSGPRLPVRRGRRDRIGMIRSRVLRAALEAERQTRASGDGSKGALTEVNYEFGTPDTGDDPLVTVTSPSSPDSTLLVKGSIVLTRDEADLVRLEGTLVKRPSFWTRRVDVVRQYARVAGIRVPVSMASTADVLIAGRSTFSMDVRVRERQRAAPDHDPGVQRPAR